MDKFQSFLKETIHGDNHLQTVYDRMEHVIFFKEALNASNPIKAKKEIEAFYEYIKLDHEHYIPPEDLLSAAKGRTHFFHGIVYAAFLDRIKESVFAYSISLINIELINKMTDPKLALDLTYSIIDTYYEFVESSEKIPMSEFSSKVMAYIDLHISEDIRTSTIATALNMDADYLQKKFKSETQLNITDAINQRRVDLAKIYLRATTYSITEIAMETGFSDSSYFGKVFKKFVGVTPTQFKKQ